MSTKKWLVVASLTLSMAGIAGCSTGDDDQASSSAPPDDASVSTEDAGSTGGPGDAAAGPDLSDLPDPVAEVNGEEISRADFAESLESQSMQAQMSGQPVDEEQLKSDTLDVMVDSVLLTQAAEEGGHEAGEEDIEALLEELATSNGLGSTEEFIEALGAQGMDEETVREEVGTQVAIEALIAAETDVQEPTEEEIRAYYDEVVEQQEQSAPEGSDDASATDEAEVPALPEFEEVQEQIADQLRAENESVAVDELLQTLREDADIVSNL